MKTIKNILALAIFALFGVTAFGQVAMTTTTLSAAISSTATSFVIASATGVVAPSFAVPNQPTGNQTVLYVDREAMFVTGINGTFVSVLRGYRNTVAEGHANAAIVYVGPPSYFSDNDLDHFGSCIAANETALPRINIATGHIFSCGTSGQWIQVNTGTMGGGQVGTINFNCTGTVGSAETEFIGSTIACSGSTSNLLRWTAQTAGTIANFRAKSSANFLGTGGSIFTVFKNGSAVTGFTCAPTAATTVCNNLVAGFADSGTPGAVDSVAVAAGDQISVSFLSANTDTAANISITMGVY